MPYRFSDELTRQPPLRIEMGKLGRLHVFHPFSPMFVTGWCQSLSNSDIVIAVSSDYRWWVLSSVPPHTSTMILKVFEGVEYVANEQPRPKPSSVPSPYQYPANKQTEGL